MVFKLLINVRVDDKSEAIAKINRMLSGEVDEVCTCPMCTTGSDVQLTAPCRRVIRNPVVVTCGH